MIRAVCRVVPSFLLFAALIARVQAQEARGFYGVFEGYENHRLVMRTTEHSTGHWVVDSATQFEGIRPASGDWIYVLVEPSGHIANLRFAERPQSRTGTISAANGDTLTVQSGKETEEWNVVDTTQLVGVGRGALAPGEQISARVYRNHNMAVVRLLAADPVATDSGVASPGDEAGNEITAQEAPPPLPVYEQPPCPEPDYIWTPGYWNWGPSGYFWVPGTWVAPPRVGLLWTPGYWGFLAGAYVFHTGYWGEHVGFYGGVHYGGGYFGEGFAGGRWEGRHMTYNTAVVNVNTTVIHNTYVNTTVINNTTVNNVSYSGGPAGARSKPTAIEIKQSAGIRFPPTGVQVQSQQQAASNPQFLHINNHGVPPVVATARPLQSQPAGKTGTPTVGPVVYTKPPPTYPVGNKPTVATPSVLQGQQPSRHAVVPVNSQPSQHAVVPVNSQPSQHAVVPVNSQPSRHAVVPVNSQPSQHAVVRHVQPPAPPPHHAAPEQHPPQPPPKARPRGAPAKPEHGQPRE